LGLGFIYYLLAFIERILYFTVFEKLLLKIATYEKFCGMELKRCSLSGEKHDITYHNNDNGLILVFRQCTLNPPSICRNAAPYRHRPLCVKLGVMGCTV